LTRDGIPRTCRANKLRGLTFGVEVMPFLRPVWLAVILAMQILILGIQLIIWGVIIFYLLIH